MRKSGNLPVPLHLRNAPTSLMKELGYGEKYQYAHNYDEHFVQENYLPESLQDPGFYQPANNSREEDMRLRLDRLWKEMKDYGKKK